MQYDPEGNISNTNNSYDKGAANTNYGTKR